MSRIEKTQRIILLANNENKLTHNQGLCLNFQLVQIVGIFLENKGLTWIEFIVKSQYLVAILSLA